MNKVKIYNFDSLKKVKDLGSYKTSDGKTVKYNLLIRGVKTTNIISDNDVK